VLLRQAYAACLQAIVRVVADLIRVACVQLESGADKGENVAKTDVLVERAAEAGARIVVLPEKWNGVGNAAALRDLAEPLDGGKTVATMADWALRHDLWIVGGSITELREGRERLSNTCCVFAPGGELAAVYRKIHLFDVEVGGRVYRESDAEEPGGERVLVEADGWGVGLTVCYDLRFPELYRLLTLEGAEILTVPANFTLATGKDHWHVLLRARAIESQCYVLAAAQVGEPMPGRPSYGHSVIVDPWGTVLADAPDEETVIVSDLDRARLRRIRTALPSLANRRPEAYR
jgi:deaminated glutathione amidase